MTSQDTPKVNELAKPWVVLLCVGDGGPMRFRTVGPMTLAELKAQIHAGRLHYSDYAWKEGYKKWVRIALLDELAEPNADILDQFAPSRMILEGNAPSIRPRKILEIDGRPSADGWVDADPVPPEASCKRL